VGAFVVAAGGQLAPRSVLVVVVVIGIVVEELGRSLPMTTPPAGTFAVAFFSLAASPACLGCLSVVGFAEPLTPLAAGFVVAGLLVAMTPAITCVSTSRVAWEDTTFGWILCAGTARTGAG
jgi:hypothetical protein